MKKYLKYIGVFCLLAFVPIASFAALDLTGIASVNVTSDTSATAKNMAFNEARRQIVEEVLSNYSNKTQLKELMKETKDSALTNLISSTSIDSERLSATTYSANIKMTVDAIAATAWLDENNVNNWMAADKNMAVDKATIIISISNGLRDWIELNQSLLAEKIDMDVKRISGGQVTANIPVTQRASMIAAVRSLGWNYSDNSGYIRIWK